MPTIQKKKGCSENGKLAPGTRQENTGVGALVLDHPCPSVPTTSKVQFSSTCEATSSSGSSLAGHKFGIGEEVSVEGKVGERAPRTTIFPAFVAELLPGGGYDVRPVL